MFFKNQKGIRALGVIGYKIIVPCGKVLSFICFLYPVQVTKGVKHKIHERQKHDATLQLHRRENSVNMNLEVEDPLYAKVQRRTKNNINNRQGPNSIENF